MPPLLYSRKINAIPQICTSGGDVYYASHNLLIHLLISDQAVYTTTRACDSVFTIQPHACGSILNPWFWIQPHAHVYKSDSDTFFFRPQHFLPRFSRHIVGVPFVHHKPLTSKKNI